MMYQIVYHCTHPPYESNAVKYAKTKPIELSSKSTLHPPIIKPELLRPSLFSFGLLFIYMLKFH